MSPHGLGSDINGFLYIGNAARDPVTQLALAGVDKYTCDGTLVEEDFLPPSPGDGMSGSAGAATNIYSVGNIMYMNGWRGTGYNDAVVFAYDICTRELIGTYTVCDDTDAYRESWDFHIDEANNRIIINNYQSNGIAIGDLDTHLNGPCVPIELGTSNVHRSGITLDDSGNIYVRHFNTLTKYDSNYVLQYTVDLIATGGSNAWAVVYSQSTGYLYLAGNDADCISVYDPADGSYIMQGVANPPNASPSKAVGILTECCPTNNNVTIDTTLCEAAINDTIFLQNLINCDGTICEGIWQEGAGNIGLTYNSCNNSVAINALTGCGTFTLESDGSSASSQCGAFKFEVNISLNAVTASIIAGDQDICTGEDPDAFTVTTAAVGGTALSYQWQSSTTNCTTGFSNISGAINETYDPPTGLTQTTYYRVVVNSTNEGCTTGNCTDTSNCISVTVYPSPTVIATATGATCAMTSTTPNGDGTVTVSATASGGDGNYNYIWDNNLGNGASHTFIPPSSSTENQTTIYNVTAIDGEGCRAEASVSVTIESSPIITVNKSDEHCNQSDGYIIVSFADNADQSQIEFSIDGGTSFPYSVGDGSGSFIIGNLSAGSYDLWARWEDGDCPVFIQTVVLNNLQGISVTASSDENICTGEGVVINANASEGTFPYLYTWENNLGNGQSKTVYPTTTTTYTVMATDNFGCTATDEVTITVLPTTNPACSTCIDPADDDSDGICASEDCDDDDPNLPAPVGTTCDDGNLFTSNDEIQEDGCTCVGIYIPCSTTLNVLLEQPNYNDNETVSNFSDDTFTFEATIAGNGNGWNANGQTGIYGQTIIFGPYPVDASGIVFDVLDEDNPNCRTNVAVNISSCIVSGVCTCCN